MFGVWEYTPSIISFDWELNIFQFTLSEQYVSGGGVHIVIGWLSRVDHEPIDEFHRLSSLSTQFSTHDDLATLGTRLHDEPKYTVAGTIKSLNL